MNTSLYLDGLALYIVLALMAVIAFCFIVLGMAHIKILRENEELKRQNRKLEDKLLCTQDKLYKATFKTPEVD